MYGFGNYDTSEWALADWEKYARSRYPSQQRKGYFTTGTLGQTGTPNSQLVAWRGGWLSPEQRNQATWAEQQALASKLTSAYDEAKATNEARYAEILAGYKDRYSQAEQGLEGLGQSAKSDIQRRYAVENSRAMQQLLNSGLLTTTVAPAVSRQITAQETRDIADLNERLRRERLGLLTQLSGEKLSFMERREDTYPQLASYYELLRKLGAA